MTTLGARVFAGVAGSTFTLLVRLLLVPVYLKLLGAESYGLVGFYASLIGMSTIIDAGLSTAINREIAGLRGTTGSIDASRVVVYSLATVYWAVGAVVGVGIVAASPAIANHWLHASALSPQVVTNAVALMGINFAFQWPDSLYAGALQGLNQHVRLNKIRVTIALLQTATTLALIAFVIRSVVVVFACGAAFSLVQTLALRWGVARELRSTTPAKFSAHVWRSIFRFAGGNAVISILSTLLTQLDKVVLSRYLDLDAFGYYALASSVASASFFMASPIVAASFPDMSRAATADDQSTLERLYRTTSQVLAAIVVPVAAFAFAFAPDLLEVYLRDPLAASNVIRFYRVFLIGAMTNALVVPAFFLQLAHGWTRLSIIKNTVAVILYAPGLWFAIHTWGAVGGAAMSIVVNLGYVLIELPVMHHYVLRGRLWRWYGDMAVPIVVSIALAVAARAVVMNVAHPLVRLFAAFVFGGIAIVLSAACFPELRAAFRGHRLFKRIAREA